MIKRRSIIFLAVGLISGCGFRLRGTNEPIGKLPEIISVETVDPHSPFVKKIVRQLREQGTAVVTNGTNLILKITPPESSSRILGPVSKGDQTELALEMTYSLTGLNTTTLIPETKIRSTIIYVDGGKDTSAKDQRLLQLKDSLESDLLLQIVPSLRIRYEQVSKQLTSRKVN